MLRDLSRRAFAGIAGLFGLFALRDSARAVVNRVLIALLGGLGRFGLKGRFDVECYGPDGALKWRNTAFNAITNAGLDHTLNSELRNQTQVATWYMGLVDNAGFSAYAAADVMSSHAGWAENQDYSQSTRPTWTPAAPSSQAVANSSTVDFSMNATKTIRGLFITSANDKGGTTGTLFSEASFTGGNQAVNSGDTLKVTYTVSASST